MSYHTRPSRVRATLRRHYGVLSSKEIEERLEKHVWEFLAKAANTLPKVKTWAWTEADQHKKFGGTLRKPRCWMCRKSKPITEFATARAGVCVSCDKPTTTQALTRGGL